MPRYQNAARVLPSDLLTEVQRYAAGMQLYVPRPAGRLRWGERTGAREALSRRNDEIRRLALAGATTAELMDRFHLGYDAIRKIAGACGLRQPKPTLTGENGSSRSGG